ncbi:MAG: DUF2683 family protein [Bacteroidota bacterium]
MKAITIKAYTRNDMQIEALKAFLKALNIEFELDKESSYNEDFVSMVKEAEQDIKDGKGKNITSDEFDDLWK